MRKIEEAMLRAITNTNKFGVVFTGGNTKVTRDLCPDGNHLWKVRLYNTVIAQWECPAGRTPSGILLNHGGFPTVTTKSRMNAILHYFYGYGIHQQNYRWFVGSRKWDQKFFMARPNGHGGSVEGWHAALLGAN